jgi:hypothetical protein
MQCPLRIAPEVREMEAALFRPEPLGLSGCL